MDQPSMMTTPEPKPRWPWFVGALIPVLFFAIWIASNSFLVSQQTFAAAYLTEFIFLLLGAALFPMILAGLLHVPGLAVSVAGFGVPSPIGLLLSVVVWALLGRGMYALYHARFKIVFWLILIVFVIALGIGAYMRTADFRAADEARKTGTVESCDRFRVDDQFEIEKRGYCLINAAVTANDPTICDLITNYQRTACYRQLNAPYTPLPGMK